MQHLKNILLTAILAILLTAGAVSANECPANLDFETDASGQTLSLGQIIDEEWASNGVHVTTHDPANHPAMIFNSASPTGGDHDLGTPNQDFGGPGVGSGGGAGKDGQNSLPLGKVLIISEDGDSNDPDDNAGGGVMTFGFSQPVVIETVDILDVESNEPGGSVMAYGPGDVLLVESPLETLGDNSIQSVQIGAGDVLRLEVHFCGSGAVARITSCDPNGGGGPGGSDCVVSAGNLNFGKKNAKWTLSNDGADPVVVDQITASWPPINGNLKKVKLGADVIWEGDLSPLTATIQSTDLLLAPSIAAGESKKLKLIFQRPIDQTDSLYDVTVDFAEGCFIEHIGGGTLPNCDLRGKDELTINAQQAKWKLINAGAQAVTLDSIDLDWPAANGALKKIKLRGETIWSGLENPPYNATSFSGATSLRTIVPGEQVTLQLKFENTADPDGDYTVTVGTDLGCSDTIVVEGTGGGGGPTGCPCNGQFTQFAGFTGGAETINTCALGDDGVTLIGPSGGAFAIVNEDGDPVCGVFGNEFGELLITLPDLDVCADELEAAAALQSVPCSA